MHVGRFGQCLTDTGCQRLTQRRVFHRQHKHFSTIILIQSLQQGVVGFQLESEPMLNIGRNIAITIVPMIAPRNTMMNGSISEVRVASIVSTSSS